MFYRLALVAVTAAFTATSCSLVDTTTEGPPTTQARTTTSSTTTASTMTVLADDGLDVTASVGLVTIGEESFDLDFDCFAPGAGEILAVGLARTSDGRRIEAYVQAFLGLPYVGISIIDETPVLYEAAVDQPLDITHSFDTLRVDDVALVTDLDLETGIGTDAGFGTIVVECRSYSEELPAEFTAAG